LRADLTNNGKANAIVLTVLLFLIKAPEKPGVIQRLFTPRVFQGQAAWCKGNAKCAAGIFAGRLSSMGEGTCA